MASWELIFFFVQMELNIAFFARLIGDHSAAEKFSAASQARRAAINSVFWNAKMDQWLDYWLINSNSCKVKILIMLLLSYELHQFLKYSACTNPSTRELTVGMGKVKMKTFLLLISFLYGLISSTQVGDSVIIFWHL